MSKLYEEDSNRELIGEAMSLYGCLVALVIAFLAWIMPGSVLNDTVFFWGEETELWEFPFAFFVLMAMAGIALMAWDK